MLILSVYLVGVIETVVTSIFFCLHNNRNTPFTVNEDIILNTGINVVKCKTLARSSDNSLLTFLCPIQVSNSWHNAECKHE